ncbi:MAG: peptidylprolyl isomerase [Acidobacteria bacterium]|nr:peptidylprolyl isomerase [Acidobacteriota bacterium]
MARSLGAVFCLLMVVSCDRNNHHPQSHDANRKSANHPSPIRSFVSFSQKSRDQLKNYQVILKTSLGNLTLGFFPDVAPEHVRNFLRLFQMGFYDHTAWHRVVRNFVIQGGDMGSRNPPLQMTESSGIRRLQPEFSKMKHVEGMVSMARAKRSTAPRPPSSFAWPPSQSSTTSTRSSERLCQAWMCLPRSPTWLWTEANRGNALS